MDPFPCSCVAPRISSSHRTANKIKRRQRESQCFDSTCIRSLAICRLKSPIRDWWPLKKFAGRDRVTRLRLQDAMNEMPSILFVLSGQRVIKRTMMTDDQMTAEDERTNEPSFVRVTMNQTRLPFTRHVSETESCKTRRTHLIFRSSFKDG